MLRRPLLARARRGTALLTTSTALALLGAGAADASIPFDLGAYDGAALRFDAPFAETAGSTVAGDCDVTGDGRPDVVVGAPGATAGGADRAGRVYVVPGSPTRAPGSYALSGSGAPAGAIVLEGAAAEDRAGVELACAGDVDGDGSDDVAIAAPGAGPGTAYVVFGGSALAAASPLSLGALGAHGFTIRGPSDTLLGTSIAGVGDLDGDGFDEVAVGDEWGDEHSGTWPGTVYVVAGRAATTPVDLTQPGSTLLRIHGAADNDRLKTVARAGDVDGDGTPDLVVGATEHDGPRGPDSGAAYAIDGRARGDVQVGAWSTPGSGVLFPVWSPRGTRLGVRPTGFGADLAPAGDVNGDGRADLAFGLAGAAASGPVRGLVAIVYGKSGDDPVDLDDPGASAALIRGLPASSDDSFGTGGLASLGDVDGDGRDDLVVGAARVTAPAGDHAGAAFLLYGTASTATRDVADLTCEGGARLHGGALGDALGVSAGAAGDGFTSANAPTLLVGAGRGFVRAVPLTDVPDACGRDNGREPRAPPLDVDWGFRENFRRYVTNGFDPAAPAVPISASAGATCDANPDTTRGGCDPLLRASASDPPPRRALRWTPVGASATDGSDATVGAIGRVTFRYPGHFFTLNVEDPWFVVAGGQVTLRARVDLDVAAGFAGARSTDVRVDLGTFPLDGAAVVGPQHVVWRTEPGTLTDEAAVALGGFLGRRSQLDPVTIAIPRSLGPLPQEPRVPEPPQPRTPDPTAPDQPRPPVKSGPPQVPPSAVAAIAAGRRRVTVRRAGRVTVATVRCTGAAGCRVSVPASVRLRAGRARVALRVVAPKRIARGRRAVVRVTLTRAAVRTLAGRSATLRVPIAVRSGGRRATKTVSVTLTVPRGR